MYEEYSYYLYPSIIRTSRQIAHEASHVLYNENGLIRISSCGHRYSADVFRSGREGGHAVPILAFGEQAQRFTRHAMEMVMLRESVQEYGDWDDVHDHCFVIAGNDLPRLCHTLLVTNLSRRSSLDRLTLAIEIYPEDTTAMLVPVDGGLPADAGGLATFAANSTPVTYNQSIDNIAINKDRTPSKDEILTRDKGINLNKETKSTSPHPRVLRLLEPLRKVHSLHGVYIEGAIDEEYQTGLLMRMLGPPPSDEEFHYTLCRQFHDALIDENLHTSLTKIKLTLDTMKDQKSIRPYDWDGSAVISIGSYTGDTLWDAQQDINIRARVLLAWAFLNAGNASEAEDQTDTIIYGSNDADSYWNTPPKGHTIAIAFHLQAHVSEKIGNERDQPHSFVLSKVVRALREGLRHQPGNQLLERELSQKKAEQEREEEFEDLMELWRRMNEQDIDEAW